MDSQTIKAINALIGTPYEVLDCFGVARNFYSIALSIELKHYYDEVPKTREESNNLIYSSMGDFIKVDNPQLGDLILMKMFGIESHIAVYLGEGKILHTQHVTGCVVADIEKYKKVITGFYRVNKND